MDAPKPGSQVDERNEPSVPKNLLHRIINRVLDTVGIQQDSAWRAGRTAGHSEGYQEGFSEGRQSGLDDGNKEGHVLGLSEGHVRGHEEGRTLGFEEGHTDGFAVGHKKGFEKGKLIIEVQPGPIPMIDAPGVREDALFKDWRFPITDEMEAQIRTDVAVRLPNQMPSTDQWKMILSRTPTTSVVAGAGSGKSTTMVLRLLVLRHYLGIDFSNLTVVTFTVESKLDFAKKVRDVFKLWGYDISPDDSLKIVRTFHSRILSFARCLPGMSDVQPFEFLDKDGGTKEKGSMFQVKMGEPQLAIMNDCYMRLYEKNPDFKALIGRLYRHSLAMEKVNADSPDALKAQRQARDLAKVDDDICDTLERLWSAAGKWPIDGVEPTRKVIQLLGQDFQVNGYVPELDAFVILGVDKSEPSDLKAKEGRFPFLTIDVKHKRILFQAHCSRPVIYLRSYLESAEPIEAIKSLVNTCPKFTYKLDGDIAPQYITEAFYGAASYMENLGLDVFEAIRAMRLRKDDPDRDFFHALAIYWNDFTRMLFNMSPPVMTFNTMFAIFSERKPHNLRALTPGVLRPMTTLLIDEFQDVGANTISWIRATFAEIERRNLTVHTNGPAAYASLMAVGDDWQSIYGWRGSSPHYLIDFDSVFESPAPNQVLMQENHRSHQMVIDAAEEIVKHTPGIPNKHGTAKNASVIGHQVPVEVRDLDWKQIVADVERHYSAGDSILVLTRSNSVKEEAREELEELLDRARAEKRSSQIKFLTYHSAKGLQAKAVFLLGDCDLKTTSPSKNDLYAQAGLNRPGDPCGYDTAQSEEALRTAYVAVTRAITYCYWYLDKDESRPALEKASRHIKEAQPYWNVVKAANPTTTPGVRKMQAQQPGSRVS
ncbi:DNA helicase UvrD [Pseudomonas umsongensis]|uniref:UvrD-helicase domain-containing protein n=1 Tax=Pseudomonas umsongensis TaxID=198618 RepID=UPI0012443393|nr:UvrD-helicase domain-containing protein [Pseudomonas umsongensis]QFG30081.1 DNA helicase UvrD [Pseudomonas umsongensis]